MVDPRNPRPEAESELDAYSRAVVGVAALLRPSVAALRLVQLVRGGQRPRGQGSAIVLSPDGLLLTSAHVVAGSDGGQAELADGTRYEVEIVGADPLSDLAVVRVGASDLPTVSLGDSDALQVGQLVVAVGAPLGFAGSVSAGIVSGLGRTLPTRDGEVVRLVEDVIQTDASFHPGNSGGALADAQGRVVGVATALVGPGFGQGLGLAVPINERTLRLVGQLIAEGRVHRAWLGVAGGLRPLPPRAAEATGLEVGIEVLQVVPDSPAARAGIRPEDILVRLDGTPVRSIGQLQELLDRDRISRRLPLEIVRGGQAQLLEVEPAEL